MMGKVSHSHASVEFTATRTIGLLAHILALDPYAWAAMRTASGLYIASYYTLFEAWMQAKITNSTRGRTMATYRIVDLDRSLGAQLLISFLPAASYISYNILALLCCAILVSLTLTTVQQPAMPSTPDCAPLLQFSALPWPPQEF